MLPQSGKNEAYNKAMCALFVPMGLCQWPGLLSSHHEYCGCELSDYFLFLTFLIYPAVSSKFFSVFPCEDFEDGSSFLKAGTQAVQVAVCVGVGVGVCKMRGCARCGDVQDAGACACARCGTLSPPAHSFFIGPTVIN